MPLKTVLNNLSLLIFVTGALQSWTRRHYTSTLKSLMTNPLLPILFSVFGRLHNLVLISELDLVNFLLLLLYVLRSKMLLSLMLLELVRGEPGIDQRFLNVD